jgi:hypothetical protein
MENFKMRKTAISAAFSLTKNTFLILTALSLAFLFVACPTDGGGGMDKDEDTGITTIEEPVAKSSGLTLSFTYAGYADKLDDVVPGSTVNLSGGTVTIKLKTPIDGELGLANSFASNIATGITTDSTVVKCYVIQYFMTSGSSTTYYLSLGGMHNESAFLIYATDDVTIKGKGTKTSSSSTTTHDFGDGVTLEKGWNYLYKLEDPVGTYTYDSSTSVPGSMEWTLD